MLTLIKYDIQKCWKKYMIFYLICFLFSVLAYLFSYHTSPFILGTCHIISICAFMMVFIDFFKNNFQSLYGKKGALLQTLPLSHHKLLLSKVLEGIALILLSMLLFTVHSIFIYHCFHLSPGYCDSFYVLFSYSGQSIENIMTVNILLEMLIKIIVLTMVLLTVYAIWTVQYCSFKRFLKLIISILIAVIALVFFILVNPQPTLTGYTAFPYPHDMGYMIIFYSILCFILYIITKYLLDHKLEL